MSTPVATFEGSEDDFKVLCDPEHIPTLRGILNEYAVSNLPNPNSEIIRTGNLPRPPISPCGGGFSVKGLERSGVAAAVKRNGFDVNYR